MGRKASKNKKNKRILILMGKWLLSLEVEMELLGGGRL